MDIGAEDMLDGDGLCVIEWADIVSDVLPADALVVRLEYGSNENERIAEIL
jgi:tRNA threonylcarbamoyladenosine biosynthesis protein TsaE